MKKTLAKTLGILVVLMMTSGCDISIGGGGTSYSQINTGDYIQEATKDTAYDLNVASGKESLQALGKKKILVLPITVKDYEQNATEKNRENLEKTFFGAANETGWNSVSSFYYKSSFGQFDLSGVVADWYDCGYTTSEIVALGSEAKYVGVTKILNAALASYKKTTGDDCSQFDYDKDGYIDGVMMVYSAPNSNNASTLSNKTFSSFTTWVDGAKPDVTNPVAKAFSWSSYDLMYQGYGTLSLDAHKYICEMAHILGAQDYYDYSDQAAPMGCIDMMDYYNIIDHDVFTKFQWGWVKPYIINAEGTISIRPSQSSGDCILIPLGEPSHDSNSHPCWNGSAYDEYIMLEYYSPTGLNLKDSTSRYLNYPLGFTDYGVRIYHVDARLAEYNTVSKTYSYTDDIKYSETSRTYLAHANTLESDSVSTKNYLDSNYRLIQEMDCTEKRNFASAETESLLANNSTLFKNGSSFSLEKYSASFPNKTKMNGEESFPWTISFNHSSTTGIEVTFSLE